VKDERDSLRRRERVENHERGEPHRIGNEGVILGVRRLDVVTRRLFIERHLESRLP
jgi:hypothetical protein